MTGLLLDTELTAEQRDYAETVRSSGEALLGDHQRHPRLLEDRSGQADHRAVAVRPAPTCVEEVAELLAPQAEAKGIELIVRYAADAPTPFDGDADRLRQVLMNLVGNAVKFTDAGHVLVSVDVAPGDGRRRRAVRVAVSDTGIGIAPDKLAAAVRDVHAGRRVHHAALRRHRPGAGDLARAGRADGRAHRGREPLGEGSTFSAFIPLPGEPAARRAAGGAGCLARLSVLIVDDSDVSRQVLVEQVTAWGLRAEAYAAGVDALQALRGAHAAGAAFDLVIADQQMPGLDGAGLAAAMRGDSSLRDTVFVMLTSVGSAREIEGVQRGQIDAYVTKPVRHERLLQALATEWTRRLETRAEGRLVGAPPV